MCHTGRSNTEEETAISANPKERRMLWLVRESDVPSRRQTPHNRPTSGSQPMRPSPPPFDNSSTRLYFRTVGESDLPSGPRKSLKKLREKVSGMKCRYCKRVGSLQLADRIIYEDRAGKTNANCRTEDTHTGYKVHVLCQKPHNDDAASSEKPSKSHIHCFYLPDHGGIGLDTTCSLGHGTSWMREERS
jgi:hypothetical protein